MATPILIPSRLRELLSYDPASGVFTWRVTRGSKAPTGSIAGHAEPDRYVNIMIDRKLYKAHRLAWLYMTGEWPPHEIDHVDRDKSNNTFTNLRLATPLQNRQNIGMYDHNTSGHKGVTWHRANSKWQAQIKLAGRNIYLGCFNDLQDAVNARLAATPLVHRFIAGE